ncbi:MAG: hypothetical protein OHK0057_33350 [Thermoflexibacter sp.]
MKNLLFIFIVSVLFSCGAKQARESSAIPEVEEFSVKKKKKRIFIAENTKEILTEGDAIVEISYPLFKNTANLAALDSLNNEIKLFIETTVNVFESAEDGIGIDTDEKVDTINVKADEITLYKGNAGTATRSLFIDYKINHRSPEYVEIDFGISKYLGGAHPMHNTIMFHYDLSNNKYIEITNLFGKYEYWDTLRAICKADLLARREEIGTNEEHILSYLNSEDLHFRNFTVANDTLSIYFEPYEVAPYAAGPQVVKIPFSNLSSMIDKNSLLFRVGKNKL